MKFHKVIVDRKEENKFRRRALRKFPNEYIEVLFGYIENECLRVTNFVPVAHKGQPGKCDYFQEDIDAQNELANTLDLRVVGTIHTHPFRDDALASVEDYRSCVYGQDLVIGIMSLTKKKGRRRVTDVAYWPLKATPDYT
jgi:proteasome lid subunit RPN8/RPN11